MDKITVLKPVPPEEVRSCEHVRMGASEAAAVTFQPEASTTMTAHSSLLCRQCAIAVARAVREAIASVKQPVANGMLS
jgi:hypothetical protein